MRVFTIALALILFHCSIHAQQWVDSLDEHLKLRSHTGDFSAQLSGLLDLEGYYIDQRPPGLLYDQHSFFSPRLSLFLDAQLGRHIYVFAQGRLDRGFDPGAADFEARADEYFLRWTPFRDSGINLQFGKFATVVGSWVQRHDSWQNPLITAPLPYENLFPVSYDNAPSSASAFLARRRGPDIKESWLPVVWGPAYTTGWSVFGSAGQFDYAVEVKNAAISSPPDTWDLNGSLWRYPTVSGRVGFRPGPSWNNGLSFSVGPYLSSEASETLPSGKSISDYDQFTLGYDVSYAWKKWQLWGEVFATRFEVPNVGNANLLAYYLETKYKLGSGLYAALRWNQEIFDTVSNGMDVQEPWDGDMYRIDLALGYRFNQHLQGKIQYSFGHRHNPLQQGEQLAAMQLTLKF